MAQLQVEEKSGKKYKKEKGRQSAMSKEDNWVYHQWETRLKGLMAEIEHVKQLLPKTEMREGFDPFDETFDPLKEEAIEMTIDRLKIDELENIQDINARFESLKDPVKPRPTENYINNVNQITHLLQDEIVSKGDRSEALGALGGEIERDNRLLDKVRLNAFEHLAVVLSQLEDFVIDRFHFFLNGFFSSSEFPETSNAIPLIQSAEIPPEPVLRNILNRASFDLSVIQRAIAQRNNDVSKAKLDEADQLANIAMSLAYENKNVSIREVKPITYFQRDTTVRLIPYGPYLFIGLPYSAMHHDFDLLGIPHEIAHYVYNRGIVSNRTIKHHVEALFFNDPELSGKTWARNWLEEIFADIYSLLVAGPIVGLSIQEIMLDNEPFYLSADDGEHPVGRIRPNIYTLALEQIYEAHYPDEPESQTDPTQKRYKKEELLLLVEALETRWTQRIGKLWVEPDSWMVPQRKEFVNGWIIIKNEPLHVDTLKVVSKMVKIMQQMGLISTERLQTPWLSSGKIGASGPDASNGATSHLAAVDRLNPQTGSRLIRELSEFRQALAQGVVDDADLSAETLESGGEESDSTPEVRLQDLSDSETSKIFGLLNREIFKFKASDVIDNNQTNRLDSVGYDYNPIEKVEDVFFAQKGPYAPERWLPFYEEDGWIDRNTKGSTRPVGGAEDIGNH